MTVDEIKPLMKELKRAATDMSMATNEQEQQAVAQLRHVLRLQQEYRAHQAEVAEAAKAREAELHNTQRRRRSVASQVASKLRRLSVTMSASPPDGSEGLKMSGVQVKWEEPDPDDKQRKMSVAFAGVQMAAEDKQRKTEMRRRKVQEAQGKPHNPHRSKKVAHAHTNGTTRTERPVGVVVALARESVGQVIQRASVVLGGGMSRASQVLTSAASRATSRASRWRPSVWGGGDIGDEDDNAQWDDDGTTSACSKNNQPLAKAKSAAAGGGAVIMDC